MSKTPNPNISDVSPYVISPVTDNPFVLHIIKQQNNSSVHLATLEIKKSNVIITLTEAFEDWYFNTRKKEYDDFLFSLWMAESLLKQHKEA